MSLRAIRDLFRTPPPCSNLFILDLTVQAPTVLCRTDCRKAGNRIQLKRLLVTVRKRNCGKVMFSPWADPHPPTPIRWPLQRTVRILLECILVYRSNDIFLSLHKLFHESLTRNLDWVRLNTSKSKFRKRCRSTSICFWQIKSKSNVKSSVTASTT